ncbi:DNA/RNA non-specific endonuclease [Marinicellulosiphila megalodicopiae]|uniref:DNA/RNA non-specific endonuclease n=1 Tax=Marinicellulosiphila megalodicopiae TaxID=2724896 RepID=UPI003BB20A60
MNKRIIIYFSLIISSCNDYQADSDHIPQRTNPIQSDFNPVTLDEFGVPAQNTDQLLEYSSFNIGYEYHSKQAAWVGYALQPEMVRVVNVREDSFKEELLIPQEYRATLADYSNSGFQRGHLAPNATLDHTDFSMSETFYLSNISPQKMDFNQFGWRDLETYVRNCVDNYQDGQRVFVFTGPYFEGSLDSIGGSNLPVPTGFYKVIYEFNDLNASALGFIAPHDDFDFSKAQQYLRSVDFIEVLTGLDFGVNIPEDLENQLESKVSPVCELPSD